MNLKFNIVTKDMKKLGYLTNAAENSTTNIANATSQMNDTRMGNLTQTLGYTQDMGSGFNPTPRF